MIVKEGTASTTIEKRLAIDITAIIEIGEVFDKENPKNTFYWVPTHEQRADHMTKCRPLHELREILAQIYVRLRERTPNIEQQVVS